jgi:hypothetical protein
MIEISEKAILQELGATQRLRVISCDQRTDMSVTSSLRNQPYSSKVAWLFVLCLSIALWCWSFGVTVWAYALTHGPYYPLPSIRYQIELAAGISVSTVLLSFVSWIAPVMHARRMSYLKACLIAGFGTELLLALRALLSSQVIFDWKFQSFFIDQFISPSTLFAEYNWLTYIFEVGPLISLMAALLTGAALRIAKRMPIGRHSC